MGQNTHAEKETLSSLKAHGVVAKFLHWAFIVFFIYALTKQLEEVEQLEDFSLLVFEVVFALIFLAILLVRFIYMRSTKVQALSSHTSELVKFIAKFVHMGMYVSLAMIAVTGLMIGGLYWSGIKNGLLMNITVGLHEVAVGVTYFLIALHIAAAFYHRFKKDGVWSSMVPIWKENVK